MNREMIENWVSEQTHVAVNVLLNALNAHREMAGPFVPDELVKHVHDLALVHVFTAVFSCDFSDEDRDHFVAAVLAACNEYSNPTEEPVGHPSQN